MNRLMTALKAGFRWPSGLPVTAKSAPAVNKPGRRGLGDVIKSATSAVGIPPCGGCQKRADWLNRKFPLDK